MVENTPSCRWLFAYWYDLCLNENRSLTPEELEVCRDSWMVLACRLEKQRNWLALTLVGVLFGWTLGLGWWLVSVGWFR